MTSVEQLPATTTPRAPWPPNFARLRTLRAKRLSMLANDHVNQTTLLDNVHIESTPKIIHLKSLMNNFYI